MQSVGSIIRREAKILATRQRFMITDSEQPFNPLDTDVTYLKGVGPARAEVLAKVGIRTLEDLLEFRPRRYLDRTTVRPIAELVPEEVVTVVGEIIHKDLIRIGRRRLIIRLSDGTDTLEAIWFNQPDLFARIFAVGQTVAFSGKVTLYQRHFQMAHPDFDILEEEKSPLSTGQLIPIYPSGQELKKARITNYTFRRIFHQAFQRYRNKIPETLPEYLRRRYRLLSRSEAYYQMHFPESPEMLHQVERRFKYEELFYLQLLVALRRRLYHTSAAGVPIHISPEALEEQIGRLPFPLTGAQRRVLEEIRADLAGGQPMNRLVQGDVGSGKTVVALLSMQMAIAGGYQTALMAPTEILAQQHYLNIRSLTEGQNLRIALLIGSLSLREKQSLHRRIAAGKVDLLIGTHALIQEQVEFRNLGLVVIDEQHRFGVMQRAELIRKGQAPHVLVMTATPIPRTLAMTLYGDLDVSIIDEMPPGRQPVRTFWRTEERLPRVYEFIRQRLAEGEQAYVVYPLIEESEKVDLKAAKEAFRYLQKEVFPEFKLALLHGRLKMGEKERIMARFKRGEVHLLVSTTVIEVGVDVPNATIMLIEHAERFGLSQLHQLRGRVGRGDRPSYCILITPAEINEVARERMQVMEATTDGFVIAEEDLRLRGSGEFFGTRQHGMPDLQYANLVTDAKIVQAARKDAFALVERDPHLRLPEHTVVRWQFKRKFAGKFDLSNVA